MRLPFRRKKDVELESMEALHSATENLIEIRQRGPEVSKLAEESRVLREKNHFAEQIELAMKRRTA